MLDVGRFWIWGGRSFNLLKQERSYQSSRIVAELPVLGYTGVLRLEISQLFAKVRSLAIVVHRILFLLHSS
jgi:hypothetical protein